MWPYFAVFLISFLLTALFMPKPSIENAQADSLDPAQFPKASSSDPVPLVRGTARLKAPNTLWYGDYVAQPIKKKIRTGLFSSTWETIGFTYYLSVDLGLCLGPDVILNAIWIDDEQVSSGTDYYTVKLDTPYDFGLVYYTLAGASVSTQSYYLPTALGVTEAQLDLMIAAGLYVSSHWGCTTQYTSVYPGDPAPGIWALNTTFGDASDSYIASDGTTAQEHQSSGAAGGATFDAQIKAPAGARYVHCGGHGLLTYPVFSTFTAIDDGHVLAGWPGKIPAEVSYNINMPDLFGGSEHGGGHVGNFTFYPGAYTQTIDPDVEASVGAGLVPSYAGTAHIVMPNNNVGEQPSLHRIEFELQCISNVLNSSRHGFAYDGSGDINPAEALYFLLTDDWSGIGVPTNKINLASFQAVAETLIAEQNGCSFTVTSPQTAADFVKKILRHIDGVLSENTAGEMELKLIRDDYTAAALTVYDESSIVEISNFSRTSWNDVVSQVKITFKSLTKTSDQVAIAQNDSISAMIGRPRTQELSFPLCYDATLANNIAARELSRLSVPLIKLTAKMNRKAYALTVGDPLKITFPELGLSELICRVQKINKGSATDGTITVELIQDIFAASNAVMAAPVDTGWTHVRPAPTDVIDYQMAVMPYFFAQNLPYPPVDGYGAVVPFPTIPQAVSSYFTLFMGLAINEEAYRDPNVVEYPVYVTLDAPLSETAGFETGVDTVGFNVTAGNGVPTGSPAGYADIKSGHVGIVYCEGEWMGVDAVTDNGGGSYTLSYVARGLLGSRPRAHGTGAKIYWLTPELLGQGYISGDLLENTAVYFKLLDMAGGTMRSPAGATEETFTITADASSPLRPRNLAVNSSRAVVPLGLHSTSSITVSWDPSNRAQGSIPFETDGAETPDSAETYIVSVYINGSLVSGLGGAVAGTSTTLDFSTATVPNGSGYIRVTSVRTSDSAQSVDYAIYPIIVAPTMDTTALTMDSTYVTMDAKG